MDQICMPCCRFWPVDEKQAYVDLTHLSALLTREENKRGEHTKKDNIKGINKRAGESLLTVFSVPHPAWAQPGITHSCS